MRGTEDLVIGKRIPSGADLWNELIELAGPCEVSSRRRGARPWCRCRTRDRAASALRNLLRLRGGV